MSILGDSVTEVRLRELCAEECAESPTLDFKAMLPAKGDEGKLEFLKDVCAFANTDGGDLVYGVSDKEGKASAVRPIKDPPCDGALRRLAQILESGADPRIVGIQYIEVPVAEGGYALVVRVPASFDGPHCFSVNNGRRFVMRSGTTTTDLTYQQLRAAFDRTATLVQRAAEFRTSRLLAITNGDTWWPVAPGPRVAVHLVPLAALAGRQSIDVLAVHGRCAELCQPWWSSLTGSMNLDGVVAHAGIARQQEHIEGYVQVFRDGAFEAVEACNRDSDHSGEINAHEICQMIHHSMLKFLKFARELGISGPALISAAVLSVSGRRLTYIDRARGSILHNPVHREFLHLPTNWIADLQAVENAESLVRECLDVLWQAFGFTNCLFYDEAGLWTQRY